MSLILSGTDGLSDVDGTAATPAIRGTDTNTGVFFPAADTVAASVGGTEGLRLTSTGLGVGTSTPGYKLDVNGTGRVTTEIRIKNTAGNVSYLTFEENGNGNSATFISGDARTTGNMGFWTNSTERLRLDSSGNLGLGVTPSAWESGQRAFDFGITGTLKSNTATGSVVSLGNNCYYGSSFWRYKQSSQAAALYDLRDTGEHRWYTAPSGTAGNSISFTQAMTLDASGRLGIGNTSPSYLLDIFGTTPGIRLRANGVGTGVKLEQSSATGDVELNVMDGYALRFATSNAERARITSNGNFYIGTTSGASKFYVAGVDTAFYNTATFGDGSAAQYLDILCNRALTNGTPQGVAANTVMTLRSSGNSAGVLAFATGNNECARITSGGLFGVNGTPPSDSQFYSATSAAGTFAGTFSSSNASTGYGISIGTNSAYLAYFYPNAARSAAPCGGITHNGTSTAFNTTSDYRLKENIRPMTGALAKVVALKPCTYIWKANGAEGEGFIAHELAEVAPQCVTGKKDEVETYTDEEGNEHARPKYQGIDTSFLVATLTAAIQEQQAIIESLTARITALEAK